VSARDYQALDKQWPAPKPLDTFCPLGPVLETDFEVGRHISRRAEWRAETVFGLTAMVFRLIYNPMGLRLMTLVPGDVIATGTPAGVGPTQGPAMLWK